MISLFLRVLLNSHSKNFPNIDILHNKSVTGFKNSKIKGTGRMLPIKEITKASYQGILNKFIATGNAPRNSMTGTIDVRNTVNSGENPFATSSCGLKSCHLFF